MSERRTVVSYQELTDGEGLALEDGVLRAYTAGALVGEAVVGVGANLHELMLEYEVPSLLPALDFCHTQPQNFEVAVTLNPFALSGEASGTFIVDGDEQYWAAQYVTHPDFRRADEVPEGERPWADSRDGKGWQFLLPGVWQTHPDLLVHRRLALALEAFLNDTAAGREFSIPYRRSFDNLFSATHPTWRINLPRVISIEERAPSGLV